MADDQTQNNGQDDTQGDPSLEEGIGEDARCARLRTALREARGRLRRLESENQALREELLSAGEMIEILALDLERATLSD